MLRNRLPFRIPGWRNRWLALFSLAAAFALWIAVTETQNPSRTGIFPGAIPVEAVNLPKGMAISTALDPVNLRISAPRDLWDRLTTKDFRIIADLGGINGSRGEVPVTVVRAPDKVGIIEVTPAKINVTLEPLGNKAVPIKINSSGAPLPGYELKSFRVVPQEAQVEGPASLIDRVESVDVDVNLTGRNSDWRDSFPLTARDRGGGNIFGIRVEPTSASLEVSIAQTVFNRAFVVTPTLKGSVAQGYNVVGVDVDPPSLNIFAPLATLQSLTNVSTEEIDVSGATSDVVKSAALRLPPGARSPDRDRVQVSVRVAPAKGEITLGISPRALNLDVGLSASFTTPLAEIRLRGDLPVLRALSPDRDVSVTVDLSGRGAGFYSLDVKVQVPSGVQLVSVNPDKIGVTIR